MIFGVGVARGEIIRLKNGKTIEARITERNERSITLDMSGAPLTYYLYEIDTIDGAIPKVSLPQQKIDPQPSLVAVPTKASLTAQQIQEADAHMQKGSDYLNERKHRLALEEFQSAVTFNPYLADGYYNIGNIYASSRQYPEAIENYKKAIELNPVFEKAYSNLGRVYIYKMHLHEAAIYLQRTIELNPQSAEAYDQLGLIYVLSGQYQQALDYYQKVLRLEPNYPDVYFKIGLTYSSLGKYAKAREYIQKAKRLFQARGDMMSIKEMDKYLKEIPQ